MNLNDLLNEMSEKMRNRDLSDEYLREHNNSTREEIGIGEYAYGITMIPCEWVYEYLSDYKRVLEINEVLLKENEEIRIKNNAIKRESEAYAEHMIRLDNELNLEKEKSKYEWIRQNCLPQELVNKLYIPIQKVKDKIEEYKNMLKTCNKVKDIDRIKAINERILELQELLEGRK